MVTRPHTVSIATAQMPSAAMPLGERIDDPTLPLFPNHEGYCWQWQTLPGQQPQWVPISKVQAVPQVDLLGLDAGAQKPTEVVPLAAQRGSLALCRLAKAWPPQAEPPAAWPTAQAQHPPARPPGPPPPKHQQPPMQEWPRQAQINFLEALAEWHRQQTALAQQQSALQEQAVALQQAAMLQLGQEPRPQQQQQPMPQQQAAVQEQQPMPMPYAMQQAVPMQQGAVHQPLGSTMPLPTVLAAQAVWPRGKGAATGTATGSGSAHAYSGSAGAGSGSAVPRTPEVCSWEWPEDFHKMREDMIEAQAFFHASVYLVGIALEHKADC